MYHLFPGNKNLHVDFRKLFGITFHACILARYFAERSQLLDRTKSAALKKKTEMTTNLALIYKGSHGMLQEQPFNKYHEWCRQWLLNNFKNVSEIVLE